MIRSMALHTVNMDKLAACERWYWTKHGAELYRRYEPWLSRFESFRAVAVDDKEKTEEYGITNWMATSGYWREVPLPGPKGELSLSTPPEHAYSFGICVPPQCTEDYKGSELTPDDLAPLRWVQLMRWPEGISRDEADQYYNEVLAPQVAACEEVKRFFSFRALDEDVRIPGESTEEAKNTMNGGPRDHQWDRMTEIWFYGFEDWRRFITREFTAPDWAVRKNYPFVAKDDFVSGFLLERPAYNWKQECHTYL